MLNTEVDHRVNFFHSIILEIRFWNVLVFYRNQFFIKISAPCYKKRLRNFLFSSFLFCIKMFYLFYMIKEYTLYFTVVQFFSKSLFVSIFQNFPNRFFNFCFKPTYSSDFINILQEPILFWYFKMFLDFFNLPNL